MIVLEFELDLGLDLDEAGRSDFRGGDDRLGLSVWEIRRGCRQGIQ